MSRMSAGLPLELDMCERVLQTTPKSNNGPVPNGTMSMRRTDIAWGCREGQNNLGQWILLSALSISAFRNDRDSLESAMARRIKPDSTAGDGDYLGPFGVAPRVDHDALVICGSWLTIKNPPTGWATVSYTLANSSLRTTSGEAVPHGCLPPFDHDHVAASVGRRP